MGELLRSAVDRAPSRCAAVDASDPTRRWTYAEMWDISVGIARALLDRHPQGSYIAIWGPTSPEWLFIEFGIALAGMTLVTINPAFKTDELRHVLLDSGAVGLFMVQEYRGNPMDQWLDAARPDLPLLEEVRLFSDIESMVKAPTSNVTLPMVSPDSAAQVMYTSGTSGTPKGAVLCHRAVVNVTRFTMERLGIVGDDEVMINPAPMFHAGGAILAAIGCLWSCATNVLFPRVEPALILDAIERERGTALMGVVTVLIMLTEEPDFDERNITSLRVIMTGTQAISPELVEHLEKALGARLVVGYGMTELSPNLTQHRLDDSVSEKATTVGDPLPHVEVKVISPETGEIVPVGEPGELCARGYQVMLGYLNRAEATQAAIDEEGWLHTGDVLAMDERGFLRFVGRNSDMIKRGGENIYPIEVEGVLRQHPGVAEVAVVGVPDTKWGEDVAAFVVWRNGGEVTFSELAGWARAHLSAYKVPRHWVSVKEFPVTEATSKIVKSVLVQRFLDGKYVIDRG